MAIGGILGQHFDPLGSAEAVKGTSSDTSSDVTVYGSKIYTDESIKGVQKYIDEQLQLALDGNSIVSGTAKIQIAAEYHTQTVPFNHTFSAPPTAIIGQVFEGKNILVKSVTKTNMVLGIPGLSSTGQRDVNWIAVGKG